MMLCTGTLGSRPSHSLLYSFRRRQALSQPTWGTNEKAHRRYPHEKDEVASGAKELAPVEMEGPFSYSLARYQIFIALFISYATIYYNRL
jgi:hypothetical protein